MPLERNAATFFNRFVETFGTKYDQMSNVFMGRVDCTSRSDIFIRYVDTLEAYRQLRGENGF
jgi:hypothetical protein